MRWPFESARALFEGEIYMNVLLINQYWFAKEWREDGHRVVSIGRYPYLDVNVPYGISHINHILGYYLPDFSPDVVVIYDDSTPLSIFGLDELNVPILFYSVDTHHHFERHRELSEAADKTLIAQSDFLPFFREKDHQVEWFPLWASVEYEGSVEKELGACFVGTLNPTLNPRRVDFFNRLQSCVPVTVTTGSFQSIFPKSHIVINQTVKGDLNFRVFEAMMSGSLLLTEATGNGLHELFKEGEVLVTYTPDDHKDAAEKIAFFLAHKGRARSIGEAGRAEILRAHLPRHRADVIGNMLSTLQFQGGRHRHLGMMTNHMHLALSRRALPHVALRIEALAAAALALEQAISAGEQITHTQAAMAVAGCLEYDVLQQSSAGARLIDQAIEAWPGSPVLGLVRIWRFMKNGLEGEARVCAAKTFMGEADQICVQAQQLKALITEMYGESGNSSSEC